MVNNNIMVDALPNTLIMPSSLICKVSSLQFFFYFLPQLICCTMLTASTDVDSVPSIHFNSAQSPQDADSKSK